MAAVAVAGTADMTRTTNPPRLRPKMRSAAAARTSIRPGLGQDAPLRHPQPVLPDMTAVLPRLHRYAVRNRRLADSGVSHVASRNARARRRRSKHQPAMQL